MYDNVFKRIEQKYLITKTQYSLLIDSINDYLDYCRWTEAFNITSFVTSENVKTESGDVGGFATNGNGVSA